MPDPVGAPLVGTHDPDSTEPHPLVGPDRSLVGSGRVDGQPVVTPLLEQVAGQRPDGIGADAAPLPWRAHGDVDAGMAVVGLVLLAVLDEACHGALDLDHEAGDLGRRFDDVVAELLGVKAAPPCRDGGIRQDLRQGGCICRVDRAERNQPAEYGRQCCAPIAYPAP